MQGQELDECRHHSVPPARAQYRDLAELHRRQDLQPRQESERHRLRGHARRRLSAPRLYRAGAHSESRRKERHAMTPIRRQRGTTLIVALIMLVLLTLFAVSSLNTANTNVRV